MGVVETGPSEDIGQKTRSWSKGFSTRLEGGFSICPFSRLELSISVLEPYPCDDTPQAPEIELRCVASSGRVFVYAGIDAGPSGR